MMEAARRAIALNLPFALFALPDSQAYRFYASMPDSERFNAIDSTMAEGETFFASLFALPLGQGVMIKNSMTPAEVLALPSSTAPFPDAEISAASTSTSYSSYYAQHRALRQAIAHRKVMKAVLSRRIAIATGRDPVDIASSYFATLPSTFRAIFFTQETGLWITATPELLVRAHQQPVSDGSEPPLTIETMSLAGSRWQPDFATPWDSKNLNEHDLVLEYIASVLRRHGLRPYIHQPDNVSFDNIEHLCHRITSEGHCNVFELIDHLSPTPALGGYPVSAAIDLILHTEQHNRHCYGGVVGVLDHNTIEAYVNIRCCLISPGQAPEGRNMVNIFAGGGIVRGSVAREEWHEAANKARPLYYAIAEAGSPDIWEIPEPWGSAGC